MSDGVILCDLYFRLNCCVYTALSRSSSASLMYLYIITSRVRLFVCLRVSLSCSCVAEMNIFKVWRP